MTFELGRVCTTRAVAECFNQNALVELLNRYCYGDWGNLCEEDKEADRSCTTILFPYEY